jgi:dTDP-4-amino-4,6-dideoxygalactose transaminase
MRPYVTDAMRANVAETLTSRFIGQGPKVDAFERQFNHQVAPPGRESIAVGSCTDALHLAYLLAGIGPGDEVIAPVFTCTATNIPLLWLGAKIRFADVSPDSLNVDPVHVRSLLSEKTKAIVVVHYGGEPVDLLPIWGAGVPVIEDCAQALGARYEGLPVGRSRYACYSFQAVKHVTTGDGGMLTLPDEYKLQHEKARRMRWFGIDRKAKLDGIWANDITEVGYKYQMTDIGAAMGMAGLDRLDYQLKHRHDLVGTYVTQLRRVPGIQVLNQVDRNSAAWLLTVLVDDRAGLRRKLAERGIESDQVHYRNDRYSIFDRFRGEFPNMDAVDGRYLCLPLHMGVLNEDVVTICSVIREGW